MILDTKRVVIELEHRGVVPLEDAGGTRIDCLRGRVWITEHRSTGDIVLEAGDSYEVSGRGVAVVQALREALVALCAPALSLAGAGPGLRPLMRTRDGFAPIRVHPNDALSQARSWRRRKVASANASWQDGVRVQA